MFVRFVQKPEHYLTKDASTPVAPITDPVAALRELCMQHVRELDSFKMVLNPDGELNGRDTFVITLPFHTHTHTHNDTSRQ